MKMTRIITIKPLKLQKGMTLIELLVAGVISLIAVSGMVLVMATTLGTTTQTIEMSRLTNDMRTAMQIMTRELRRANYHSSWITCYGNPACLDDLGVTSAIAQIEIGDSDGTDDCLWFWYDRPQPCPTSSCTAAEWADAQTALTAESVAAFRLAVNDTTSVGRIQMTTTRTTAASCNDSADWVDITDPNVIDVETFTVSNSESILENINTPGYTLKTEKIGLTMTARLTADPSVPSWLSDVSNTNATRKLTEFIKVRNNFVSTP
jgi:Tfp pilus assembly protein PilW